MLLKYHMGIPLLTSRKPCPDCYKEMDIYGDHAMTCKVSSGSIHKHDSIVEVIFDKLRKSGIPANLNVGPAAQDNYDRPGDIHTRVSIKNGHAQFYSLQY